MKKVVMGSLVLGAVMGGLAVVQMPQHAQAATYQVKKLMGFRQPTSYYAKSAKSGYLWNKSHTKRLHNLKNYSKTTRYATAKYSMKSVRNSGTYLKVTNGTGKAEGYVWTGYLKKGVNPANLNGTLTDPFGAAMSTYNVDDNLNKQLLDLFPGTIPDEPLQLAADFIFANAGANPDDYTSVIEQLVGAENEPSVFRLSSDKRIQKNQNFLSFQRNSLKDKLATKHKSSRVLRDIESVRMLSLSTTNGMECRSFFCCLQIKIANYGNKNMDPNLVKVLRFRSIFLTR